MSSAGGTARWRCAGAPRAWSRLAPSSAASTGICTFGRYAPPWNATPPTLSDLTATVTPKPPPEHRTAAEVLRRAGQPPRLGSLLPVGVVAVGFTGRVDAGGVGPTHQRRERG